MNNNDFGEYFEHRATIRRATPYRLSDIDLLADGPSLSSEIARAHAERLAAETERWCWKAVARGVGNRVWRSDSEPVNDDRGFRIVHRFAILAPGQCAPGSGMVFGPFSKEDK